MMNRVLKLVNPCHFDLQKGIQSFVQNNIDESRRKGNETKMSENGKMHKGDGVAQVKINEHEQALRADAEREQDCVENKESCEDVGANLIVPGVLKDLKLGPVSGVVTRGSGGRPAEVPETSLGCGVPQPGELRLPPRHALGHTLKDQRSIGEVSEARERARFENLNEMEEDSGSKMVGEELSWENQMRPTRPTGSILFSKQELLTAVEAKHVDASWISESGDIARVQVNELERKDEGQTLNC